MLKYGERLRTPGLNLLSAPGNDAVATSALAGAGCHMVLFTTGRGIAVRWLRAHRENRHQHAAGGEKPHWIDFNAGRLLEGTSMEALLAEFVETIVAIANGQPARMKRMISASWQSSRVA